MKGQVTAWRAPEALNRALGAIMIRLIPVEIRSRLRLQHTAVLVCLLELACLGASACATIPPTCLIPTALELDLETSDRVNLDENGRSLPTLLRIYQLTDISLLQRASFEEMLESPKQTLGQTLVKDLELTIYPGQRTAQHLVRESKADYIVGVAVFRNPLGSAWRTIAELPLEGDPCKERNDHNAAPKVKDLRVRMFLGDYRIESTDNFAKLPKRSCNGQACQSTAAPDELPEEMRHRRLRDFEEDPSRPTGRVGPDGTSASPNR
ncbi:MAG: type secretion system lipoprotein TssJ [Pseudomonadota bacterium]|jgi:type VI secretion system protein VasD